MFTFYLGSTFLKLSIDEPYGSLDIYEEAYGLETMALEDMAVESWGLVAFMSGDTIMDFENAIVLLSIFLTV